MAESNFHTKLLKITTFYSEIPLYFFKGGSGSGFLDRIRNTGPGNFELFESLFFLSFLLSKAIIVSDCYELVELN